MKVRLKLFFNWGITFDEKNPYTVKENANRKVKYASRQELEDAVIIRYPQAASSTPSKGKSEDALGGMVQKDSTSNEPQTKKKKAKATDKRSKTEVSDEPPGSKKRKAHAQKEAEQNESP